MTYADRALAIVLGVAALSASYLTCIIISRFRR